MQGGNTVAKQCRNRVANRAQYVATNNVAICCVGMLCAFGHRVTTCWVLLAKIWPYSNLSQQHLATRWPIAWFIVRDFFFTQSTCHYWSITMTKVTIWVSIVRKAFGNLFHANIFNVIFRREKWLHAFLANLNRYSKAKTIHYCISGPLHSSAQKASEHVLPKSKVSWYPTN